VVTRILTLQEYLREPLVFPVVAGTGHRPHRLGGYDDGTFQKLCSLALKSLSALEPQYVISGMALGWDQALATSALELRFKLDAAIPFEGQERRWPINSQKKYRQLLQQANVINTDPDKDGLFRAWKMQVRNQYMVDNSHVLLALWDGTSGGTENCIRYALKKSCVIINLWDEYDEL